MQAARIVQITDLHILGDEDATLSGVKPSRSLAKVIDDIRLLSPPPKLVIASGDLTDQGSEQAYQNLQRLLNRLPCAVYVMAGNHDETEVMNAVLPADNIVSQRQSSCEDWQLIFVNSKDANGSNGFVTDDELEWLEQQLEQAGNQPVLLAMHHTPLTLCASATCQFKNADALLDLLQKYHNVKALIAGHTHNNVEEVRGNLRIMTTPSTMVQVTHNQHEARTPDKDFWDFHQADTSRHGYRVVDLFANGELESTVHWVAAK